MLVVAEKEQSLKVLADKVPPEIRDLIVSILGADEEGRRQLGAAITDIQSGVAGIDPAHSDAEIVQTHLRTRWCRPYAWPRPARPSSARATLKPANCPAPGPPAPPYAAVCGRVAQRAPGVEPDPGSDHSGHPAAGSRGTSPNFCRCSTPSASSRAEQAVLTLPDPATVGDSRGTDRTASPGSTGGTQSAAVARVANLGLADGRRGRDGCGTDSGATALQRSCLADGSRTVLGFRRCCVDSHDPLQARRVARLRPATSVESAHPDHAATRRGSCTRRPGARPTTPTSCDRQLSDAHQRPTIESGKLGFFAKDAKRALERCHGRRSRPGHRRRSAALPRRARDRCPCGAGWRQCGRTRRQWWPRPAPRTGSPRRPWSSRSHWSNRHSRHLHGGSAISSSLTAVGIRDVGPADARRTSPS